MELEGNIVHIGETQSFGNSGFKKRELAIKTNEQYPQTILIEFVQDKTELLNSYQLGDGVKIGINIRGREWVNPQGETKYFNTLQGWRIQEHGSSVQAAVNSQPIKQSEDLEEDNDLPF